jgi:hypothetical protein
MTGPVLLLLLIAGSQPVTIEVRADSVIGVVSPYLYGSGDEMNEDFSQHGVDSLVSYTGIPLLRMGGIAAEYYDWEANDYNGIWYVDFVDTLIWADSLTFGIDSLLQFCDKVGAQPVLTVNFQINDPGKAGRLVEYCNGELTSPMGAVRAARGHPEPYNVTQWCIGNEPDISGVLLVLGEYRWTVYRHFGIPFEQWSWRDSSFVDAGSFSALVDVYVDSMRARSPIPIEIGGLSLASNLSWVEPVIGGNNEKIDWVDIHYYPNASFTSDSSLYRDWLAATDVGGNSIPLPTVEWYAMVCDSVAAHSGGNDIPVYIFEYGGGRIVVEDPLWHNYLEGLFAADAMGHFAVAGVPKAAVYSIYEGSPDSDEFPLFGRIRGDTLSLRMGAHVLRLYVDFFGETLVDCTSDLVGLNAYASMHSGDTLSLIVVNKDLNCAHDATITIEGFASNGSMMVWDIARDAPLAAPWNGTTGICCQGEHSGTATGFDYTFPKASVTALVIPSLTSAPGQEAYAPQRLVLRQNRPNPCASTTTISYSFGMAGDVRLRIYDLAGHSVRNLVVGHQEAGDCSIHWDGRDDLGRRLAPGVYVYRLSAGDAHSQQRRLVLAE